MSDFLSITTPTNLDEEHAKFSTSRTYNPIFHYTWQDEVPVLTTTDGRKRALYDAILAQDHGEISRLAGVLFEADIQNNVLKQATACARDAQQKKHTGSAKDYASLLQEAFRKFGLTYEITITDKNGFNARPQPSKKRVVISKSIHYEFFSMEGGVHHELVHILRYENGKYNGVKRSLRYLPTEEGLASWTQDHTVEDSGRAQHAAEYVGSSIGLGGSLRDIYDYMVDIGMSKELAWKRASRHKFGFIDTGKPGDIMKPAMYFAGEVKVDELSREERLRLFVGKIGFSDLPEYPAYMGRWDGDELSMYFHL